MHLADRRLGEVRGRQDLRLRLGIAACLALIGACRSSGHDAAWRHTQELLIAEAVLHDLAEMPAESYDDVRTTFCIGVGENVGTSAQDPDPSLLEALKRRRSSVFPASACEMRRTLVRKESSDRAVLLGVGRLEWKSDEFVRVVGWRFVSPVAAAQWTYTLTLSQGRWTVDTSQLVSIS